MVTKTSDYKGAYIIQDGMPCIGFINSMQDNARLQPATDDQITATFTNTHYPLESNSIDWKRVEIDWVRSTSSSTPVFDALFQLYGIMSGGEAELIGEIRKTNITSSPITETICFDLAGGGGEPQLIKEAGSAESGKIQLNIPMRFKHYESITLKHAPFDPNWNYCKIIPVTGPDYLYPLGSLMGPYYLTYNSNMNADFSDLRFAVHDGTQFIELTHCIYTKTDSTKATVFVWLPQIPVSPAVTYVYMFYGNPDAASTSDPTIIYYFDDYEDGAYISRTSPYKDYIVNTGTPSIISTGQIRGDYSIKHVGGNNVYTCPLQFSETNNPTVIDLDWKLTEQGSGTYDPWVTLFYLQYVDDNNFLRLDTYWSGTYQKIRLQQRVGGVSTSLKEYNWTSSKAAINTLHYTKIVSYLTGATPNVTLYLDGVKIMSGISVNTGLANTNKGFGCMESASAVWDTVRIRPYFSGAASSSTGYNYTIGTTSAESSVISPDSTSDELQSLLFTLSDDYLSGCPKCFDIKEVDNGVYESPDTFANATTILKLGYDHVGKYNALRVVPQILTDNLNSIEINNIRYIYDPIM